jgi:hypothetical protein
MPTNECDTNADTCCLGKNFLVLHSTFRTADVYAYDTSIKPIENVSIVTGATAYDDPVTATTYILVFHESLYHGTKLDHSLINPNQIRSFGIPLWDNPFNPDHDLMIDVNSSLQIPLHTSGTKVGFQTRVPTKHKLAACEQVQMTSSHPWNPTEVVMIQQATHQGGRNDPWKRQVSATHTFYKQYEYLEADSNDALLDSIDPSLARTTEVLQQICIVVQANIVYE